MKSVLVITPCSAHMLKSQGHLIAEKLEREGARVGVISEAKSGVGRLLDIAVRGLLLINKYDVLLVNVYGYRAFVYEALAIFYGKLFRKRVVVMLHGGWLADFIDEYPKIAHYILSLPHLNLTPHNYLKKELSSRGIKIDYTIPNFIEIENYKGKIRSKLKPKFLYMRGTHHIYNPQMAIKVFSLIQKKIPAASLTFAGREDNNKCNVMRLAKELKLQNINFVGQIPKEEIPGLAEKHDLYIQTNRIDNMPVSIIEMWALGLPVIATRVGGVPYLVRDGVDGILTGLDDVHAMAEACINLLENSQFAKKLSTKGLERAKELSWENTKSLWNKALFPAGIIY